ncbi:PREDICTED: uncharacterized protein LOC108617893 isoform X2 [Drosophila arizonae]|uniref:Uncharacterized protein, isoform B n=2 Tax=mojavensis species complex TaxID=198037 RepID=B4L8M4_DROMO|nr:PREDICTED: uncharacterized protein LOC108617893 isoform X2 [Drosophila arizonae]EDW07999.2 uncharacterized protein Dmoj_GI14332, isoform B [Drosophila mojavensis]
MSETIAKVIYGTVLLAMILQTPRVSIVITYDPNRSYHFNAGINGIRSSFLVAALFTMMAVLPVREFNGFIKPVLLLRITERTLVHNSWNCFAKALLAYCALFGFATELMLHWYSIYQYHNWQHAIHEKSPAL